MLTPTRQALFDRLGGFDALERAVTACFARVATVPDLAGLVPAARLADAHWQVQLLLTEMLGGPMAHDGPDPDTLCQAAGIDARRASLLIDHLLAAFGAGGAEGALLDELRQTLAHFAHSLGLSTASPPPVPVVATRPVRPDPDTSLVARAEVAIATAGAADWPLFVLDAELVVVHQNAWATAALPAADADLRRGFGLGATELVGQSVLRFHSAPTQLHGMLNDTLRLPREILWSFGRTTWRARLFTLPEVAGGAGGFAIAWRDESEAHRRDAIIARLRAQAEELPVPVMFPDATGERWYGNAACEHALGRLEAWLPAGFDPSHGIPGALFFPDAEERRSLFTMREALPLKKRLSFGPETVAVLVSAVCDDHQQMLCPQVTWEIVHSIVPPAITPKRKPAPASLPVPAPAPDPAPAQVATVSRPRGLREVGTDLRREARAVEASARAMLSFTELLNSLADQTAGDSAGMPGSALADALDGGEVEARLAEQGLVALEAAREIADGEACQEAVRSALAQLMAVARRTNRLVLDASLSVVEDAMGDGVGRLLERSAAVRGVVDAEAGAFALQAEAVSRQLAQSIGTASRLVELRDALREAPLAPAVTAAEVALA